MVILASCEWRGNGDGVRKEAGRGREEEEEGEEEGAAH